MSAAKKAKANFEKVAKKKPDPEGLSVAEQAQTALTGKDFATAKDLFEKAQAVCEGSEAKAVKVPKVGLGNQGTPGARVARLSLMTVHRAARTSRGSKRSDNSRILSSQGREGNPSVGHQCTSGYRVDEWLRVPDRWRQNLRGSKTSAKMPLRPRRRSPRWRRR